MLFIINCNRRRLDDGVENFIRINIYLTPKRVQDIHVYIISELIACEKNGEHLKLRQRKCLIKSFLISLSIMIDLFDEKNVIMIF